ncbi:DUF4232 domain-containing protein [Amycolatopsis acidicola]|uniref:DUF4232 domain-containing protein n=1 Tax=Amycolatopsis acidicola TaxID=2596893 RepID=A0A5N0V6Z3_9PSEU|nr:DUF4232 domain-containing protein [Amycolatopsis acidicola]
MPDSPSSVSATPAPAPGQCDENGLSYSAGPVDAALGHRAFVVTLRNCGTGAKQVSGYPDVTVLNGAGEQLDVRIDHGNSYMARDPGPRSFSLEPGKPLLSVFSWSSTVSEGEKQTGAAVTVAVAGERARTVPVDFIDLGTTGQLSVTAWNTGLLQ